MLVDHPVVPHIEPATDHRPAVVVDADLSEHRMIERQAVGQPEMNPTGGVGGHADARPHPETERDDAERPAPTGERIEHAVGGDVRRLAGRSEHGARRRHEHEQAGAASFEFVGQHERGAGLGVGDEPEVVR